MLGLMRPETKNAESTANSVDGVNWRKKIDLAPEKRTP
jgi:hypothetical protein